jgi:hypothetical protein
MGSYTSQATVPYNRIVTMLPEGSFWVIRIPISFGLLIGFVNPVMNGGSSPFDTKYFKRSCEGDC